MSDRPYVRDISANDALPLEYKLHNRNASREVNVADIINNTDVFSFHRTQEGSFKKQLVNVCGSQAGVLNKYVSDH